VSPTVRAAGAVLLSAGGDVCVVHRPAYDDWSLPKGKLESGEHPLTAAVREVREETGVRAKPLLRLPDVSYTLPDGRDKTVDFWLMRSSSEPSDFEPNDEVDQVAWLTPAEAAGRLTYPDDRDLVAGAGKVPPITAVTPIVRHAHAGERKKWSGNDALRPIDQQGAAEAAAIAEVLRLFAPQRLVAAPPLRCRQTLEPLDMPIISDAAFGEPADRDELPDRVRAATTRLAELRTGPRTAVCSQGKLMPHLLAALVDEPDPAVYRTPKGSGWVISWSCDTAAAISRL
jgi:8-oxo-dGTP pyrophosphatase MutT (NUDIX family)